MFHWTHKSALLLIAGLACVGTPHQASAIEPVAGLSGIISGVVSDSVGVPQMGAAVFLIDHKDRITGRTLTDSRGEFKFQGLLPDIYAVRVTLASFVPVIRRDILVQPGARSLLAVNLSTLFSSIQITYPPLENGSFMTDDWKWVLRSAGATRPVLRFVGDAPRADQASVFSETRGMLRVSAGGPQTSGIANEADMGTAFALATSLYGNNQLEVSGNLGYGSQTGVPAAAFRTTYARGDGSGMIASVTMRQIYVPGRAAGTGDPGLPVLRSISAGFDDHANVGDIVQVQYGVTMDSVSFVDRVSDFSPYARVTYAAGNGELSFAYTSGEARPDLARTDEYGERTLQSGLNSLAMFPRVTVRHGRPRVQRGEQYEVTYKYQAGPRTYQVSAYNEAVTDAALSMVAPTGIYANGEVLPDLFSGNWIFNAGDYRSAGYSAAVTQKLAEGLSATMLLASTGGLAVNSGARVSTNDPDELRSQIHVGRKRALMVRIDAKAPVTGTQVAASYQWTDRRTAMAGHIYSTQSVRPNPGLNISVRQPIPGMSSKPCKVELTLDMRNMLAEGYLPVGMSDGGTMLLVQNPRTLRGGLNLIF
jgi:hypothetical protein